MRWATGSARRLISQFDLSKPPINVRELAARLKVDVQLKEFPDEVSGALYRGRERSVIAVNAGHVATRQRFTIAHELGHFMLHHDSPAHYDREKQVGVHFRAKATGAAWDSKEIEANRFAAELLMPRKLLIARVGDSAEFDAAQLAEEFEVSPEAMTYRLAELRFA